MRKKVSFIFIVTGFIGILILFSLSTIFKMTNQKIVHQIETDTYHSKNYYVGYIEVCKLKIPLVYGTSKKELDQNIVGIDKHSTINHLILAGHAIDSVFLCLHHIEISNQIIVKYHESKKVYNIDYKKIVMDTDVSVYENIDLTLITCIDQHKRLIVHAKTAN